MKGGIRREKEDWFCFNGFCPCTMAAGEADTGAPESECAEDLLSGIHDMLSGEATSLLLSTSKEAESSLRPPMKYESGSWKSIRRAGE